MKAHKYWSLGALACMAGCFYTGCKKLMQAHKYFACGSLVCMGMAIYSGHKIAPKKKAEKPEKKGSITNFVGFPIPLVALSAHIE